MGSDNCIRETEEQKSVLIRSNDFRDVCEFKTKAAGDVDWLESGAWQAHHILCNSAITRRAEDFETKKLTLEEREYLEDCLWITEWDLNNRDNLIALPTNRYYREQWGAVQQDEKDRKPQYLPSHQVDHNTSDGYTHECREWLTNNVWDALKDTRQKHEVTAKTMAEFLKDGTKRFSEKLSDRGHREKDTAEGTAYCWERRFSHHPEHVEQWYHPFSMGKTPRRRNPGTSSSNLTHIFAQIA